ncbi:MAG: hypothetical protein AAF227_07625 [Pseudomonadota bacterium]
MNPIDVFNSFAFQRGMVLLSIVAVVAALGFISVAFMHYGRTRDVYGDTSEKQRWTLLLGSWRDSLVITVLYTAEAMLYRFSEFQAPSQAQITNILFYAPVVQPVLSFCIHAAIFGIAILRIIVISRWLAAQRDSAA